MAETRKRVRIRSPWNLTPRDRWTIPAVRNAIRQHECGQFELSSQLAVWCKRNPRVASAMERRTEGMLDLPFSWLSPYGFEEDDPAVAAVIDDLGAEWPKMAPRGEMLSMLDELVLLGLTFACRATENTAKRQRATFEHWPLSAIDYSETDDQYTAHPRDGGAVPIEPGNGEWICVAQGRTPWMHGKIRSIAKACAICDITEDDFNRWSEVHGKPIVGAMVPAADLGTESAEDFYDDVVARGSEMTLLLPQYDGDEAGYDVKLIEAASQSWQGFLALQSKAEANIAITLLGQNLSTEVKGGSFAAAKEGGDKEHQVIGAPAIVFSDALREQHIAPWVAANRGADAPVPHPHWDTEEPADVAKMAAGQKLGAEALAALQKTGYEPEDVQVWAERFGFGPIKAIEKPEPVTAPPVPPDAAKDDDAGSDDDADARARHAGIKLASGFSAAASTAFIEGQLYADGLADSGAKKTPAALDLKGLRELVAGAKDYADLRRAILDRFGGLDVAALANLMQKGLTLAEMNGRHAVLREL